MKKVVFKLRRKSRQIVTFILFLGAFLGLSGSLFSQNQDASTILSRYAKEFQTDITLTKDVSFAIKVDDQYWHVDAKAKTDSTGAKVSLNEGKPKIPTFYFHTDISTLNKINNGELNALTASAKAFESDFAPFDVDTMEGFQPGKDFMSTLFSVYFHFWTLGAPEVIPFGMDYTRFTHGAQASLFYYQKGFRSGYVAIKKGQHANKDEKSKTNPFPTLLIAIRGEGIMIVNGIEAKFSAGQAILIPAGVTHEFLNPDNEAPLECILLMFGEGA